MLFWLLVSSDSQGCREGQSRQLHPSERRVRLVSVHVPLLHRAVSPSLARRQANAPEFVKKCCFLLFDVDPEV